MEAAPDHLRTYVFSGGVDAVSGWLGPGAISAILAINDWQKWQRITGDVAEIGIHHGKLFLLLKNLCANDEFAFAIDIFEDQHLNVDVSGRGSTSILKENIYSHTDGENIKLLKKDSLTLSPYDFRKEKSIRLFSVDGSHTAKHTLSDLRISTEMLAPGGVVILDDLYNPSWPGVQEGFHRFITHHGHRFSPVAFGENKMIIARAEDHREILSLFKDDLRVYNLDFRDVSIYGRSAIFFVMRHPQEVFTENLELHRNILPHSNIKLRLAQGWHTTEAAGVWSAASTAELQLEFNGDGRLVTLVMNPFLHSLRQARTVTVAHGEQVLACRDLTGPESLKLDLRAIAPVGPCSLRIDTDPAERPADFGGTDVRPLGVLLSSVSVQ